MSRWSLAPALALTLVGCPEPCAPGAVYTDADGDGFGAGEALVTCVGTAGVAVDGDCDDGDPDVHPEAEEQCNDRDDDCDGRVEEPPTLWYTDADGDGWGDDTTAREACHAAIGAVEQGGDCNDGDAGVYPTAEDACDDAVDADCDPRDLQCSVAAEYPLDAAEAHVYAPGAFKLGEYLAIGDVNGDGVDDVAATTMAAEAQAGGAFVAYGPLRGEHPIAEAGDRLTSSRSTVSAGRSIGVGDLNDDGIDDVSVGAPDETCRQWVMFGPLGGERELSSAEVQRTGEAGTEVGHGSAVGDLNGDGVDDLLVGAYEHDGGGRDAGAMFVEFGPLQLGTANVEDTADFVALGESAGAYAARYVATGKDVTGDGIHDALVAAPYASGGAPSSGAAYLVAGGQTGTLDLAQADAKYLGEGAGHYAGEALGLGDVSGDGLADVLLGALSSDGGASAGAAYVVFGPGREVDSLRDADLKVYGESWGQEFGLALSGSDIDGDDVGELIIGARGDRNGGRSTGGAYLFWGPVAGGLTVADADSHFVGTDSRDRAGSAVGVADLDGDGTGDVVLGAPGDSTGGNSGGGIFGVYMPSVE